MKSYVGIFKLLPSRKTKQRLFFRRFVLSEFVKTCDELVIGQHNSKFGVAGTKDKRSISTQKVCIRFVTAEKLCRAVKTIRSYSGQRVNIGNFSYEKDDLDLGDLKGNKFTIVLRNVAESKETIEKSVSGLKNNGFINYFGQQRFGTDGYIKTSDIGLALIKSDWMKAVELILRPRGTIFLIFILKCSEKKSFIYWNFYFSKN